MMDIKEVLLLWFTNKKSAVSDVTMLADKSAFKKQKLAGELDKPILKNIS